MTKLSEDNPNLTEQEKKELIEKIAKETPGFLAVFKKPEVRSPKDLSQENLRELIYQIAKFINDDLSPNRRELMIWQTIWRIAEGMTNEFCERLKSY